MMMVNAKLWWTTIAIFGIGVTSAFQAPPTVVPSRSNHAAASSMVLGLFGRSKAVVTDTIKSAAPPKGRVLVESSAASMAGAGPIQVDMNEYNLKSLEQIAEEWTAVMVPASPMQEEGVYLEAKSKKEIMADTIKVAFPRVPGKGLGLELLELAGGRDDGLGITIIENVVDGGCAAGSGILPGDSIIKVEVQKQTKTGENDAKDLMNVQETVDATAVSTECLGFDKTIESILSLPPVSEDPNTTETFILTLKRLRRKPKVKLNLQYPPDMGEKDISIELFAGENLRRAMLVRGVKLNDPLAERFDSGGMGDCGAEGTCATCAVSITKGQDLLSPPKTQEAQIFKKFPRRRMACKVVVGYGMKEGELTIRISPRQWADGN